MNIDWGSIEKYRNKRDSCDIQAEKRDSNKIAEIKTNHKLNSSFNRRISLINNEKQERMDQVHRITEKKVPVFFSQKIDDIPKNSSKPYLSLWSEPNNLSLNHREENGGDYLTDKKTSGLNN